MFTSTHVLLYRLTDGRLGGSFRGAPVLLLTTIGSKSGRRRTTPLLYVNDGDRIAVVASNNGRDKDPSWWYNMKRNPQAEVQIENEKKRVGAAKASPEEKRRLWPLLTKIYPTYDVYQTRTKREIPVIILTPISPSTGNLEAARE